MRLTSKEVLKKLKMRTPVKILRNNLVTISEGELKDTIDTIEALERENAELEAEIERMRQEAEKIPLNCRKQCTMGMDMELIRSEAKDYPLYKTTMRLHELQLKECPEICPKYKKEGENEC